MLKRKELRKNILRIGAALMCVALMFSTAPVMPPVSGASSTTQAELDRLRGKQKELNSQKEKIKSELETIRKDKKNTLKQKTKLEEQISVCEQDIEVSEQIIATLNTQIALKSSELETKNREETAKYERLRERIRIMYELGDISYIAIVLDSENIGDMLARADYISSIVESDRKLLSELRSLKQKIASVKAGLEADRTDINSEKVSLEKQKKQLDSSYSQVKSLMASLSRLEKEGNAEYDEIEKEEEEIAKKAAALAAQLSKGEYVGGTFLWPLPGYSRISSYYGYRTHPVTGAKNSFHSGIDIPAPSGTSIKSANAGTIVKAEYYGSYGNCIMVDHGGGYVTLYAHLSKYAVKKGDKVSKGQTIGYVGSTGRSTGPHLHFSIIKDGNFQNPLNHYNKS